MSGGSLAKNSSVHHHILLSFRTRTNFGARFCLPTCLASTVLFDARSPIRSSLCDCNKKQNTPRYSVGLDDAAAVELMSATGGDASELKAHRARKAAREREGNKINSALLKLENVRILNTCGKTNSNSFPAAPRPVRVAGEGFMQLVSKALSSPRAMQQNYCAPPKMLIVRIEEDAAILEQYQVPGTQLCAVLTVLRGGNLVLTTHGRSRHAINLSCRQRILFCVDFANLGLSHNYAASCLSASFFPLSV